MLAKCSLAFSEAETKGRMDEPQMRPQLMDDDTLGFRRLLERFSKVQSRRPATSTIAGT
jgi:hypothetical protein